MVNLGLRRNLGDAYMWEVGRELGPGRETNTCQQKESKKSGKGSQAEANTTNKVSRVEHRKTIKEDTVLKKNTALDT